MPRIKCVIAYDGTHFSGYQVQPGARTVQGEFESVLQRMHKGAFIRIHASGRTDAGVHARGQVLHFDPTLDISCDGWQRALNTQLPDDIVVTAVERVEESFHARYSARSKEYRYRVCNQRIRDVFGRHYAYHVPYALDLDAMQRAVSYLIGTHDFTSFSSAKTTVEDKERTITKAAVEQQGHDIVFRFIGNGFLYNMVRILVGTLLEVGRGERAPDSMATILQAKDRAQGGKTAPGHGLVLWKVSYK